MLIAHTCGHSDITATSPISTFPLNFHHHHNPFAPQNPPVVALPASIYFEKESAKTKDRCDSLAIYFASVTRNLPDVLITFSPSSVTECRLRIPLAPRGSHSFPVSLSHRAARRPDGAAVPFLLRRSTVAVRRSLVASMRKGPRKQAPRC